MTGESRAAERTFADLQIGESFEIHRTFTSQDVQDFARLSGDFSPLHVDDEYARTTEFGQRVVHGMLVAALFSQLVGMQVPGKHALYLGQDVTWRRPVHIGDPLRAIARVVAKSEATSTVTLATEIRSPDDQILASGTARVKVRGAASQLAQKEAVSQRAAASGRPVALVTGGSRGLGAEIARSLATRGHAVAVNYVRNRAAATAVVESITAAGGVACVVQADVREAEEVERMVAQTCELLGPPTRLVNGATGELTLASVNTLGWSHFLAQLEYQVKAVLQVCLAVHPHMKAAGGGAIVNLASQVVEGVPAPKMSDYVTAKSALAGLTRALAIEWAAEGIRVNAVSPSLVQTDLTQHYGDRVFRGEAMRTPLRRVATPKDVANAVAYLLEEQSAFLTGTNLFVTGGQVMS